MTLKIALMVTAALGAVFGLAFLLVPVELLALYGLRLDPAIEYVPRYLGATFLGFAVVNWFAKDAPPEGAVVSALVLGNLISTTSGLAVSVLNAVYQPGNGLIWSTVIIYLGLAAGFGYFQFARKGASAQAGTQSGTGTLIPH